MAELQNDRFLRALWRKPVDCTPVWMMRQAGRYLPEYRATRSQAGDFLSLCKNADFACEVTLQPLDRYALDAAILFSDILTVPDAMGLGLYFEEGEGPKFKKPLRSAAEIDALQIVGENELDYVMNAVSTIRKALNGRVPLIGFSGSPWTLATYMIEGGGSKEHRRAKTLAFNEPLVMHRLLDKLAQSVTQYLNGQIKAGAQVLQIFDTWGGALSEQAYEEFSLRYMQQIIGGLIKEHDGQKIPVIVFTKNGGLWLEKIANCGCDAVGLDWTIDIAKARARIGDQVALQGNMDPSMLYASPERIREEVGSILASYGSGPGHIFNLGHGITPEVDPYNAGVFIDAVHELSAQYHS